MDDEVPSWRQHFSGLDECVHLISHSLGCVPDRAGTDLAEYLELWRMYAAGAWDEWLPELDHAAARIERLLSAPAGTVAMSTSVSAVHAILASCFEYSGERDRIVYSSLEFPSVSYVWKAEERRHARVHIVEAAADGTVSTDALCAAIDERTLLVPLSYATHGTGAVPDVKAICQHARAVGAHVILDCYQALGAMPVDVVDLGVAFACGGLRTYLCGGPGAAYLYVRPDLIETLEPRVTGWLGNEAPFALTMPAQSYAESIWRYMGGTPPVSALYQARAGLEIVSEIGVARIRDRSVRQTQLIIDLVDELGFDLRSPRPVEQRSSLCAFDFVGAADIARELNRRRLFCDYRPGVGVRIAPHFYTTDQEIGVFFEELLAIRR